MCGALPSALRPLDLRTAAARDLSCGRTAFLCGRTRFLCGRTEISVRPHEISVRPHKISVRPHGDFCAAAQDFCAAARDFCAAARPFCAAARVISAAAAASRCAAMLRSDAAPLRRAQAQLRCVEAELRPLHACWDTGIASAATMATDDENAFIAVCTAVRYFVQPREPYPESTEGKRVVFKSAEVMKQEPHMHLLYARFIVRATKQLNPCPSAQHLYRDSSYYATAPMPPRAPPLFERWRCAFVCAQEHVNSELMALGRPHGSAIAAGPLRRG